MSELIEEIKAEVPDINSRKEEMFNIWQYIFSKIDKKYYSIQFISMDEIKIIEALVQQMQFSKGREKICEDLGYAHRGETDKEVIKERIFKLVSNLKLKQQRNPNLSIGSCIGEELNNIAKEESTKLTEIKEYK